MLRHGILSLFLLFSPLTVSLGVNAQEVSASEFGHAWPTVIKGLADKGITRIGDLDLTKFAQAAQGTATTKGVQWNIYPADAPNLITGSRPSAFYLVDKKQVYISKNIDVGSLPSLPYLEIHELSGTFGLEDRHYPLENAMHILNNTQDPTLRKSLLDMYGKTYFKKENLMNRRDDGGSSVGGGGDITTLLIKNQVLDEILKDKRVSKEFLELYPAIDFEPILSTEVNFISINYKYRTMKGIQDFGAIPGVLTQNNSYQEMITIYVPLPAWEKGAEMQKLIIADIKNKILTLMPGNNLGWFGRPDNDALYIKQTREALLRGDKEMTALSDVQEFTSPALPNSAEPPLPGNYYYQCVFTQGKGKMEYWEKIPVGGTGYYSMSADIGVGKSDFIFGMINLDAQGKLANIDMIHGKERLLHKISSPKDAQISMKIPGQADLQFACVRRW